MNTSRQSRVSRVIYEMKKMDANKVKKYLIVAASLVVLGVAVFVYWKMAFFGSAELYVEGPHNPMTTQVIFNGKKILPSGGGGRVYLLKGKTGSQKITVTGPFVKPQEIDVRIEGFADMAISTKVEQVSETELAKTLLGTSSTKAILETKVFGLFDEWFVTRAANEIPEVERYFYVHFFDIDSSQWRLIERGKKISIPTELNPSNELVKYLDKEAAD